MCILSLALEIPIIEFASKFASTAGSAVSFVADLFTALLGLIGLWAVLTKKEKLRALLGWLEFAYMQQRVNRIRETLGDLKRLSFDEKEQRREIRALCGQLAGQLEPFRNDHGGLGENYSELQTMLQSGRISDAKRSQITASILGQIESITYQHYLSLIKGKP